MKVSVIIPNYNHARYLSKRIESVLNQTFQDFEVILMDDKSTDNSIDIIKKYRTHPKIRIILNEANSGSTFKQWNKGIKEAKGKYIWIAESDDYASSIFLETLVNKLDKYSNVGIAYCQSISVDENDNMTHDMKVYMELYLKKFVIDFNIDRWYQDYVNNGFDECRHYLLYKNTIPNASAVLFRKSIYEQAGYADTNFKLTGDWLMWGKMLLLSDICFVSDQMNYFRFHTNTTRSNSLKKNTGIIEKYITYTHLSTLTQRSEELDKVFESMFYQWHSTFFKTFFDINYLYTYWKIKNYDTRINKRIFSFLYHSLCKLI